MANQVASMQTSRNCGLDILSPNVHSGFWPTGLQNVGIQPFGACIQSDIASQNHVGHSIGGSYVQASPQVSLSQAQCEQFLNFLKTYMASGSSNDAQTSYQAALIRFQLANSLILFVVASFFLVIVVLFRTLLNGARLVWVKHIMAYFCCKIQIVDLMHLLLLLLLVLFLP